jgi:hypothetical protein
MTENLGPASAVHSIAQARRPADIPLAAGADVLRSEYRVLNEQEKAQVKLIKERGLALHSAIDLCGHSREISLALTKLEEAVMWAVKHVTK